MHPYTRRLLGLLLVFQSSAALPQTGFDELPNLGDISGKVISPQEDKELGAYFMRQIRQAGLVLPDAEATEYLQALGHKLALHSENPSYGFTFFLVDDPGINAFAGPGGYIGANSGLVLAAESESELAGVLAHEIAHVTQRHLARAFEVQDRLSLPTVAALLAAILIGATTDGAAGAAALTAASAAGLQQRINFTRANEKEADRVGIQALEAAGFDPYGMPQFFERLQKNAKLYGSRPPEYLSTHPVTTDRIAEATSRAEGYSKLGKQDNLDFLLIRAKLRVASYQAPRQVLADMLRYKGKAGGKSTAEQYEFALLLSKNEKHTAALQVIHRLQKSDPDRITYRLAQAGILQAASHTGDALEIYSETLNLYPGELTVIEPYATTLLSSGQPDQAYKLLSRVTRNNTANPQVYKLLAQAAGSTGRPVLTHTAMSQYYYLNGYTNQAIEQLKIAEKAPTLSSYQSARIEARINNLKALLENEKLE